MLPNIIQLLIFSTTYPATHRARTASASNPFRSQNLLPITSLLREPPLRQIKAAVFSRHLNPKEALLKKIEMDEKKMSKKYTTRKLLGKAGLEFQALHNRDSFDILEPVIIPVTLPESKAILEVLVPGIDVRDGSFASPANLVPIPDSYIPPPSKWIDQDLLNGPSGTVLKTLDRFNSPTRRDLNSPIIRPSTASSLLLNTLSQSNPDFNLPLSSSTSALVNESAIMARSMTSMLQRRETFSGGSDRRGSRRGSTKSVKVSSVQDNEKSVSESRFEMATTRRAQTPSLQKVGISVSSGTVSGAAPDNPVATASQQVPKLLMGRAKMKDIRTIRDQMQTMAGCMTAGARLDHDGTIMRSKIDKVAERQQMVELTMKMCQETRERNVIDSTYDLLVTPGYLEQAGPENVYKSDTKRNFSLTDSYKKAFLRGPLDPKACIKKDELRVWSESALSTGIVIFPKNELGGGFKI